MIRSFFVLLMLAGGFLWGAEPIASKPSRTLLILVTIEGNENLQGFFIDPQLQKRLESQGWKIEGRGIEEIEAQHFDAADAVVVLQEPYGVNVAGVQAYKRLAPKLDRYLREGGGVLMIFDDRYFQVFAPFNDLLQSYGAQVLREAVVDSNTANISRLQKDDGVTVLKTRNLKPHPITSGISSMIFPQTEGGKDSYPFALSSEWVPLVCGEKSAKSEDIWAPDHHSTYATEPVLAAARDVDKGRLVVFGAHSSLSFLHGSHPRWDDGAFLKEGMAAFFCQAIEWLEKSPSVAHVPLPSLKGNPFPATEIKVVPPAQQVPIPTWKSGVIVLLDENTPAVEKWVEGLRGKLDWVALVPSDKAFPDEKTYLQWKKRCKEASQPDFLVIDGVKMLDGFGNGVAILHPDKWPVRRKAPAINHIGREIGGHTVLLTPNENPWPAENIGGFQGFPLFEYENGHLKHTNIEAFRSYQSEDWFLVPQVVFSGTSVEGVASLIAKGAYRTFVPTDDVRNVPLKFPFLFHNERNIVVSRGALIRLASLTGPSLVEDPWEGIYYLWKGPNDHATYAADLLGVPEKAEVRIYRDKLLWRHYWPKSSEWRKEIEFASTESLHSYWLELWKGNELEAISSASRSRNFHHWAHGGGDRMNLYHSVMREHPQGGIIAHHKRLTVYGALLFNLGWGDTVAIRPSLNGVDMYPAGHEWGIPSGGIEFMRIAPQVQINGKQEYLIPKPRRMGYAMVSEDAAILHETLDRKEVKVNGRRAVQPAEWLLAETTYSIPAWEPEGLISFIVDMTITPLQNLELGIEPSIQVIELVGRLPQSFSNVVVGQADKGMDQTLFNEGGTRGQHFGKWFCLHPDPLGSAILAPLDENRYSLAAAKSSKGPRISLRLHPGKATWNKGESMHVRFAVAISTGIDKNAPELAQLVIESWQGKRATVQLDKGVVESWQGSLNLNPAGDIANGLIDAPGLAVPILLRLKAAENERLPAYGQGLTREHEDWIPLGQDRGFIYHTLPTGTKGKLSLSLGKLVTCANSNIQIDVKTIARDKIELWAHNPADQPQTAEIKASGLIPGSISPPQLTLAPGEDQLVILHRETGK